MWISPRWWEQKQAVTSIWAIWMWRRTTDEAHTARADWAVRSRKGGLGRSNVLTRRGRHGVPRPYGLSIGATQVRALSMTAGGGRVLNERTGSCAAALRGRFGSRNYSRRCMIWGITPSKGSAAAIILGGVWFEKSLHPNWDGASWVHSSNLMGWAHSSY
jgi:hypothetical protein